MNQDLEQAIEGLYDAVVAPETWAQAMHGMAKAVGAAGCLFYPEKAAGTPLALPVSPDIQEFIDVFVRDRWYLQDPHAQRGWPLVEAGKTVLLEDDISSEEERATSPYYQELHRPFGLSGWAAVSFRVEGRQWCMPLLRNERQGKFTRMDAEALMPLVVHLRRIIGLAEKTSSVRAQDELDMLERLCCPAFLLDPCGRLIRHNAGAASLLGTDLLVVQQRLATPERVSSEGLQAFIAAALAGENQVARGPFVLHRDGTPLLIEAFPVMGTARDLHVGGRIILTVTDLRRKDALDPLALQSIFGLSEAESRVASALARDRDLATVARDLGISRETARSHLKATFIKTGTHRQAELTAVLARIRTWNIREERGGDP